MKIIFTILAAVLMTATVWGQSPEKMSYQAVIRNSSNALVTSANVGMQISILQGSSIGTVVYTETQTPTTNANGLVSIEIGGGAGFSTIDWANGPYFIKTETDPTGGTTYSITGTSQLLSVPYALHAKTAESITGTVTEADPIFVASPANGITSTNITNWTTAYGWGNHSGLYRPIAWVPAWTDVTGKPTFATVATSGSYADLSNKPVNATTTTDGFMSSGDKTKLDGIATGAEVNVNADWNAISGDAQILNKPTIPVAADGSETKVTAGTNVTVTGAGTTASPYVVGNPTLTIGQSYQGGIIFWLDATGQHGLIAATADQSASMRWYAGTNTYTMALADGIGAGKSNTDIIIANQGRGDGSTYAARICHEYNGGNYGDWYLPSKYELNLLYSQKTVVGGFASAYYWSSSEFNNLFAWVQFFDNGNQVNANKSNAFYVRAVRAF